MPMQISRSFGQVQAIGSLLVLVVALERWVGTQARQRPQHSRAGGAPSTPRPPLPVELLSARAIGYSACDRAAETAAPQDGSDHESAINAIGTTSSEFAGPAGVAALAVGAVSRRAVAQAPAPEDPWPSLAAQIFDGRKLRDGGAILAIDAPYRAEDAALVPVGLRSLLPAGDERQFVASPWWSTQFVTRCRGLLPGPCKRDALAVDARARRRLHQRARRCRTERRPALCVCPFRQGGRRLLGPAAKLEGDPIPLGTMRLSAVPAVRRNRARAARG